MKNIKTMLMIAVAGFLVSPLAFANENSTVVHLENNCKYYVTKSGSGFHVIGAINHNPPAKDTKVFGSYAKTGYQEMKIGDASSTIYMDVVFTKAGSLEEAKKELEFKCMETR